MVVRNLSVDAGCVSSGQRQLKRGPSGLSPFRSDDSCDSWAGRLDCMCDGQKTLKTERNLMGDYQAQPRSDDS